MLTLENGVESLQKLGAKITLQRVAIIKWMEGRMDHPFAEQILLELRPENPTLSIATVYSTMRLLAQASVIRILSIDDKRKCFDPYTSPHGHFMCKKCKKIIDVPNDVACIGNVSSIPGISLVTSAEVFLYGICADCIDC
jgi:Fur family peroxide stress response transcriptional regulator